jgi:hypothetical protein
LGDAPGKKVSQLLKNFEEAFAKAALQMDTTSLDVVHVVEK